MNGMTVAIGVVLGIIALGALMLWKMRRRGLSASDKSILQNSWKKAAAQSDPHRRLLDADNVVCDLLGRLGYTGSMGDRLKKAGPRIRNLQALWTAHKLRNRIAHEPGFEAPPSEVQRAVSSLESVLRQFV